MDVLWLLICLVLVMLLVVVWLLSPESEVSQKYASVVSYWQTALYSLFTSVSFVAIAVLLLWKTLLCVLLFCLCIVGEPSDGARAVSLKRGACMLRFCGWFLLGAALMYGVLVLWSWAAPLVLLHF